MAAVWLTLMVFSLGVLLVGSSKLPTTSPPLQDGPLGKDTGAHRVADMGVPAAVAPQKWEWEATDKSGHEQPLVAQEKEDSKVASKNSSMPIEEPLKKDAPVPTATGGISTSGLAQKGSVTELPKAALLSPIPFGKVPQETGDTNSKEVLHVKSAKHALRSPAPKSGQQVVAGKGRLVGTQSPSPTAPLANKTNVSLAEAGMVSTVIEHWPWLEDQTSATAQALKEAIDFSTAVPRLQPTRALTTEWPWLRGKSAASSQTSVVDLWGVSTATLKGGTDARRTRLESKGNDGVSHPKVVTTLKGVWSWLDEVSTPSPTWAGDSDLSTETPGQTLVTGKATLRGRTNSRLGPATVRRLPEAATVTTSPSTVSPRGNSSLLSQCLLAISLLGLVAATFIVTTAVLAGLLWRQKRAYKRRGQRPTEMVCISSLLATEEADEARRRQPRVKRAKMPLADTNGLETEMDNLTLNSFLPEH